MSKLSEAMSDSAGEVLLKQSEEGQKYAKRALEKIKLEQEVEIEGLKARIAWHESVQIVLFPVANLPLIIIAWLVYQLVVWVWGFL